MKNNLDGIVSKFLYRYDSRPNLTVLRSVTLHSGLCPLLCLAQIKLVLK